jgi:lysophospholipase L1-like esterase
MKIVVRLFLKSLKFLIALVLCLEIASFLFMGIHNYVLYGDLWGHVPVRYDPHSLFLMKDEIPHSRFESVSENHSLNRTIWMFGGSTVRCRAHRAPDETLPALLSKHLNADGGPYHFTVANRGQNGFNSLLEVKYLQKTLIREPKPPDLIIFYDGANDVFQFAEYRNPEGHIGFRRLTAFIESYRNSWFGLLRPVNAAIYSSYIREVYGKLTLVAKEVDPDSPDLSRMAEITLKRYDHARRMASSYGSRFVLVWQPLLWVEKCRVDRHIVDGERGAMVDMQKFARVKKSVTTAYSRLESSLEKKPYFLSLRNVLCDRTRPAYRPDGIHLNPAGREMVAKRLSAVLRERLFAKEKTRWILQ